MGIKSLLDLDVDQMMGTNINPAQQYMTPAELKSFESNKTWDTILGGLGGYGSQLYQGKSPLQKLFATLQGANVGRQGTIDRYTKAVQSRMGLAKDSADLYKVEMENAETDIRWNAVKDQLSRTQDPFVRNALKIDPKGTMNAMYKSMFPEAPKMDFDTWLAGKSIGIDPLSMNTQDARRLFETKNALTQAELLKSGIDIANIQKDFPELADTLKTGLVTKSDVLFGNQPQSQQYTSPDLGTYLPEVNVNIPSTDLFGGTAETINMPAQFIGQQTGTSQAPVTQPQYNLSGKNVSGKNFTQDYTNKQQNYQNIIDRLNEHEMQFGTTDQKRNGIVPVDKPYSETYIKELLDNRINFNAQTATMIEEYNRSREKIYELLNHRGFDELFNAGGVISKNMSKAGIEAGQLWENIRSKGTLQKLLDMKLQDKNGATPFGQLNYSELKLVFDAFSALPASGTNPEFAKQELNNLLENLNRGSNTLMNKYDIIYGSYNTNRFEKPFNNAISVSGQNAILGSVLRGSRDAQGFNLQPNYFYVQGVKDGKPAFIPVIKKDGKPLTKQEYYKGIR